MMRTTALTFTLLIIVATLNAQTEKKSIRQGNRSFDKQEYPSSEISYRKALEKNPSSFKGNFNLADALYKQDKHDESIKILDGLSASNVTDALKSNLYYNMGNSYLKQQKLKESIEAYKKSLRLNPNDRESKYNLAEAQRKLKQQQQQQQNDKNNRDNKDNKDNKDKNKDKKDNKDQDDKDKNKQNQDNKDKNKEQPKQQKISQEDARRMLEVLQNNEKQVQQKLREQKAKAAQVRVDKNW
jgi:Ca-activated chloride channel family protein